MKLDEQYGAREDFIIRNKLSDAEFSHLMLMKHLGKKTLGEVKMPNGNIKKIVK